ncbi:MAG TPA: HAMP domain-containing sensor histidine kinase [Polyangiaceae bacterium]|jgi:signal transduction histidine kinase
MRGAGLRLQIVLAVCGLMTLAFVPLYFAVASLTRVALHASEEDAAREVARGVARTVAARGIDHAHEIGPLVDGDRVQSVCVDSTEMAHRTCVGAEREERPGLVRECVTVAYSEGCAVVRVSEASDRAAPLTRLFAVYMTAFALALAFLVYVALTRLIVKPVEGLARATDRVASGARKLEAPRAGARELVELSQSVGAMTANLQNKIDELTEAQAQIVRSERMASVGRLAAGMAHEIGNPITAIMGIQDLMIGGDVPPAEQAEYLARMRKETERVNGILRDLLDFARPESPAQSAPTNAHARVADVMNDVVALMTPQKSFRDVSVVTLGGDVVARIAPERLTQVLLNLALNAADAMSESKTARKLTLRAREVAGRAQIEVEDTGPGIAADLREKLFLPFVTTKEVGRGTGLGLAVCRGIVEAAGGTIEIDAEYKKGARFVITLPAA